MAPVTAQEYRNPLTIFQRLVKNDRTAIADCIDTYGNLIWAMARRLTGSPEEAENAVREIFIDIWQSAERFESTNFDEHLFILAVARRHLLSKSPCKQIDES